MILRIGDFLRRFETFAKIIVIALWQEKAVPPSPFRGILGRSATHPRGIGLTGRSA